MQDRLCKQYKLLPCSSDVVWMLELDECDQLLVTNPSADDSADNHDTFVILHPLRTRSTSPVRRCDTSSIPSVTVFGSEGETRPRLTRLLGLDGLSADEAGEEAASDSEEPQDSSDIIIHHVRPRRHLSLCHLT